MWPLDLSSDTLGGPTGAQESGTETHRGAMPLSLWTRWRGVGRLSSQPPLMAGSFVLQLRVPGSRASCQAPSYTQSPSATAVWAGRGGSLDQFQGDCGRGPERPCHRNGARAQPSRIWRRLSPSLASGEAQGQGQPHVLNFCGNLASCTGSSSPHQSGHTRDRLSACALLM